MKSDSVLIWKSFFLIKSFNSNRILSNFGQDTRCARRIECLLYIKSIAIWQPKECATIVSTLKEYFFSRREINLKIFSD